MNGGEAKGDRGGAGFPQQIGELQDLTEMATAIKVLAQNVEVRMLGHSGPHGDKKEQTYDTSSPLSLLSGMRNYTRLTHESLQSISDSLNRIVEELGGVGLDAPNPDSNAGHPEGQTGQRGLPDVPSVWPRSFQDYK